MLWRFRPLSAVSPLMPLSPLTAVNVSSGNWGKRHVPSVSAPNSRLSDWMREFRNFLQLFMDALPFSVCPDTSLLNFLATLLQTCNFCLLKPRCLFFQYSQFSMNIDQLFMDRLALPNALFTPPMICAIA